MKKKLLGLAAIAVVGILFLGCTPTIGTGRTSSNSTGNGDTPTNLPYTLSGEQVGATIPAFGDLISTSTGATVAFQLGDDYTSDWYAVLSTTQTIIRLGTMDYDPDGTYQTNIYEAAATSATSTEAGSLYTTYYSDACYVTIVFETDKSIEFFKDGELQYTYASDTTFNDGSATIADEWEAFISDLSSDGVTINSDATCTMSNIYITKALDDNDVADLYTENGSDE